MSKGLHKALDALRKPDARLARLHGPKSESGFYVLVPHAGFKISDAVAGEILAREDVQPWDGGLPGIGGPQSWRLGGRRRQ
jgi:hypothetical protein